MRLHAAFAHCPDPCRAPLSHIPPTGGFSVRLTQLVELISERGVQGLDRLEQKFGGTTVCW